MQPIKTSKNNQNYNQKVSNTCLIFKSGCINGITIKDVIGIFTPDKTEIPDILENVSFYEFSILSKDAQDDFIKCFDVIIDCKITLKNAPLKTKLTISIEQDLKSNTHSFTFSALVLVDNYEFNVKFNKTTVSGKTEWFIIASYLNKQRVSLEFKKLAVSLFGEEVNDKVPNISINIENFKAFFYYKKESKESKILLGLGAGLDLNLKSLPIAGDILVEANAIAFKEVLVLYAKGEFTKEELKAIKALPENYESKKGLNISAQVEVSGELKYFTLDGATHNEKKIDATDEKGTTLKVKLEQQDTTPKADKKDGSLSSKAKWSKVDKKIGAVNLQRLGLAYHEGKIVTLLDASIETNSLGMQLLGLGVGVNLDWNNLDPQFYLDGLGLSYKSDAVEIAGAFMRTTAGGVDVYKGQARLKMKSFTLSAIGSYAKVNNESSLFIYGLYEGNIGGPPIFQVTAIAAGFGYNRKINAPEITEVAKFPLVALAMMPEQKDLTDVLKSLDEEMSNGKKPIEIASGNYWLAVGVKFTSFKIIESFILLTANFATKTEFTILGLSRLSWPEKTLRDKVGLKEPIVFVEIALKASFSPDSDVIKVDGLITPNSYVFTKDCKLSGGFAFYTWVSGEHAGDFVMTIGGYHPRFQKPAHYPEVPRVALNWKIDNNLFVRGELYFALTPSAIMLGGKWEMLYQSSNVRAAFVMWIDILMQWAPFYYDISIGIILRVEARVSLLLTTLHLNVEIRAQLDIWGPPFSGKALIDLSVYSFEITFGGTTKPNKKELDWNQFAEGFLPQAEKISVKSGRENFETSNSIPANSLDCITINITNGVIQTIESKGRKLTIANPMQFELGIDSAIPVTQLTLNSGETNLTNSDVTNSNLGVRPCGLSSDQVRFEMNVTVKLLGEYVSNFDVQKITKGFPEALWGSGSGLSNTKNPGEPKIISNAMAGLSLTPKLKEPKKLAQFDFSTFVDKTNRSETISWQTLQSKETFNTSEVYTTMKKYENTKENRKTMVAALSDFGFDASDDFAAFASVDTIYTQPEAFFRGTPKLGKIGHIVHNPTDTNQ